MKHSLRKLVFFGLCLTLLVVCESATRAQSVQNQVNPRHSYKELLISVVDLPFEKRITFIKKFISDHPTFSDAYQKLLECCLVQEKDTLAYHYFTLLSNHSNHRPISHWMLAKICQIQGDFPAAFRHFQQALSPRFDNVELIYDFIEFDCRNSGKYRALSVLKSAGLNAQSLQIASAFLAYHQENYSEAGRLFRQCPSPWTDHKWILHIWGDSMYQCSKIGMADSLWRRGLSLSRSDECDEYQSLFLTNLGILERAKGNDDKALAYSDSAETLANRIRDLQNLHRIASNRATVFARRGEYLKSFHDDEKAIRIARQIHADRYLGVWYFNNAQMLYAIGRFFEALQAFNRCETLFLQFNQKKLLVEVKYRKACLFSILNQNELAKNMFEEAYQSAKAYKLTARQFEAKTGLASLMIQEKKYPEARSLLQRSIRYFYSQKDYLYCSYCMAMLAEAYQKEGMTAQAIASYEKAYACAKMTDSKIQMAWYRLSIANLQIGQNRPKEAIEKCDTVVPVAISEKDDHMLSFAYAYLGKAYRKRGDVNNAIRYCKRAEDLVETLWQNLQLERLQIGYFSTMVDVSRELALCYFQRYQKNHQIAFLDSLMYYMEMSRARSFRGSANRQASYRKDTTFCNLTKMLRVTQRRIRQKATSVGERDSLFQQLHAIRYSIVSQQYKLVGPDPKRRAEKAPSVPIKWIQDRLGRNHSGLLVYMIGDSASFVLGVTEKDVKVVPLAVCPPLLQNAIDSLITPFHRVKETSLASGVFRAEIAHRLYQQIFLPVESAMALPEHVIIVPDLSMTNLPFEILLTESVEKQEYSPFDPPDYTRRFLLNRFCFSYSPSVSFITKDAKPCRKNPNVIVFSNPFDKPLIPGSDEQFRSYTGWCLNPLPFSDVEADGIQKIYPRTRVFRRSNATKKIFLQEASKQQILHVATHAFVDRTFDDFSGLVMAVGPDSTDDGMLMGYEISNLSLKCDLVTLSACETGCGPVVGGEGVLGLPRLFLKSGAQSVVMTLWKVDDRFASELMPEFYNLLLNKKMSKAEALGHAKRLIFDRRKSNTGVHYQHPFYWASVVLYGDPGIERSPFLKWIVFILLSLIVLGLAISVFCFKAFGSNHGSSRQDTF